MARKKRVADANQYAMAALVRRLEERPDSGRAWQIRFAVDPPLDSVSRPVVDVHTVLGEALEDGLRDGLALVDTSLARLEHTMMHMVTSSAWWPVVYRGSREETGESLGYDIDDMYQVQLRRICKDWNEMQLEARDPLEAGTQAREGVTSALTGREVRVQLSRMPTEPPVQGVWRARGDVVDTERCIYIAVRGLNNLLAGSDMWISLQEVRGAVPASELMAIGDRVAQGVERDVYITSHEILRFVTEDVMDLVKEARAAMS